jgi:pimeloyl-ACP methyl ester carboxylesterase
MYESYEVKSHWPLLEAPPKGLRVNFVRAERSSFRWLGHDEARIKQLGHEVHLLEDSGHWVHTDNPGGLLDIMRMAFGHRDDVRSITASYEQAEGS